LLCSSIQPVANMQYNDYSVNFAAIVAKYYSKILCKFKTLFRSYLVLAQLRM
jgi:hypothetical protein